MGCGQSKIHLYPRKSKSKANGKKGGHADSDAETDEDEGHIENSEKSSQHRSGDQRNEKHSSGGGGGGGIIGLGSGTSVDGNVNCEESNKDAQESDEDVSISLLRAKNLSLLQSQEISSSQQNFFRMLDQKIEDGPDYDSASETEIALEEARLNALVQHWESASMTASICSSASRSLQTTPIRQAPLKQITTNRSGNLLQASNAMPMPMAMHQQQQQQQQQQVQQTLTLTTATTAQLLNTEFLPHGVNVVALAAQQQLQQQQQQAAATHTTLTAAGPLKSQTHTQLYQQAAAQQQQQQQQQQQMLLSHMTTPKMLHHPMSGIVSMSNMQPDVTNTITTANTSNATLALMQAAALPTQQQQQQIQQQQQQQQQQYAHLLATPAMMGKANVSPKRLPDGRLLITSGAMPTQGSIATSSAQAQYITTTMMSPQTGYINGGSGGSGTGGRSPQPPPTLSMQMAYYGQSTAPQTQTTAMTAAEQQQLLQQQHQQQFQHEQQQLTTPLSQNQSQQQPPPGAYYGELMHSVQAPPPPPPTEYKFPPAISVQRLAPQVQRQLRETQELIKDSCPQLYAAGYGSPGPPIRNPNRNPTRTSSSSRPTLETQFSQELS